MKAKPVEMDEHGITGNSGLATDERGRMVLHIAAPYSAAGYVFVDTKDMGWRRCTPKQAKSWGKKPIPCGLCKRPAVSLDHHYPWMGTEYNRCAKHARKP